MNAKLSGVIISFVILILTSCKPSAEQIQMAIAATQFSATKTQETMVTPTATKAPLESIDFSKIIFQEGDLPGELTPSQIRSEPANSWASYLIENTYPINVFIQDLNNNEDIQAGVVTISVYKTTEDALNAFNDTFTSLPIEAKNDSKIENIGDKSVSMENYMSGYLDATYLIFVSCQSVTVVAFSISNDNFRNSYDAVIDYSKRLEPRIADSVCR